MSTRIGLGVSIAALSLWAVASAVVPSFTDAGHSLTRIAKRVAAGPKTPDEAIGMRKELDSAVKTYLKQVGNLPADQISRVLTDELRSSAYEVHAFDLPRGLKIVEVDTVLQACDYLVINDQSSVKVQTLPGMEVFENGKVLSESGAPTLVLVGHTAGVGTKRPLVKVMALLPGDVADESAKALPDIPGEGTASFAANNKDIALNLSLWSVGTSQKLFGAAPNVVAHSDDENVHFMLSWKDGHYKLSQALGNTPLSTVYAVVSAMQDPKTAGSYKEYLGAAGLDFVKANALDAAHSKPEFVVRQFGQQPTQTASSSRHRHSKTQSLSDGAVDYYIAGCHDGDAVYELTMKNTGAKWTVDSAKKLPDEQARVAQHFVNPTEIKAGVPAMASGPIGTVAAAATVTPAPTIRKDAPIVTNTARVAPVAPAASATIHDTTSSSTSNTTSASAIVKPPAKIVVKQAPSVTVPVANPAGQDSTHATTAKTPDKGSDKVAMTSLSTDLDTKSSLSTAKSATKKSSRSIDSKSTNVNHIADALIEKYSKTESSSSHSKKSSGNSLDLASASPGGSTDSGLTDRHANTSLKSGKETKVSAVADQSTSERTGHDHGVTSKAKDKSKSTATAPEATHDSSQTANAAPPEIPTTNASGELMQIDNSKVKVRKGPATDFKSISELNKGQQVVVLGKKDGWYKVRVNGKEGYIYGGLVNYKKSDAYTTATVKHSQNVADAKQKRVASPKQGDHLVVLGGIHDGKYKVQLANGKIGFVDKDSIDVNVDAPPLVP